MNETNTGAEAIANQNRKRLLWWGIAAVLIAVVVAGVVVRPPEIGGSAAAENLAPEVPLTDFDGERFTLASYRGRPVVVNFWASWCPSCIAEMTDFERAHRRLDPEVAFLGVNLRDSRAAAEELARSTGVGYRLAEDADGELFAAFGATGMPTTVLIDEEGAVVEVVAGQLSESQLLSLIDERLDVGS